METARKVPKTVGWEWELGIGTEWLDVYRYHHSRHIMDEVGETPKFPVQDSYGVRIHLIRK